MRIRCVENLERANRNFNSLQGLNAANEKQGRVAIKP